MPYIDFNNLRLKQLNKPEHFNCGNCIHKISISDTICKCSITDNFIFSNQIFDKNCENKNEIKSKRKCIFGIFTYNSIGNLVWTGLLNFSNLGDTSTDETAINELLKDKQYIEFIKDNNFKNVVLICILIAESTNNSNFIIKSNLLPDEMLKNIVEEANKKYL